MRVMIDTTVFLAECLLPEQKYPRVMRKIVAEHKLGFPGRQLEEIRSIMEEYFPNECDTVELFLSRFSFEVGEPTDDKEDGYPFLSDARAAGVGLIVTLDPELAGTVKDGIRFVDPDAFLNGD